ERDRLLGAINTLLQTPHPTLTASSLDTLLDLLSSRWNESLLDSGWAVDLSRNRTVYAFQLLNENHDPVEPIKLSDLKQGVRLASNSAEEVRFCEISAFTSVNIQSACQVVLQGDIEALEINHVHDGANYFSPPVLGRISRDGCGGEVRAYWED